jgi:hypothetical protein
MKRDEDDEVRAVCSPSTPGPGLTCPAGRTKVGGTITRIQSNYTGTITGGPPLSAAATLDADAYEKINIAVPDGANVTVDVMPAVADALQLLIIKPDKSGLANLTFKVNDAARRGSPARPPAALLRRRAATAGPGILSTTCYSFTACCDLHFPSIGMTSGD